jgi:hypothetical protein
MRIMEGILIITNLYNRKAKLKTLLQKTECENLEDLVYPLEREVPGICMNIWCENISLCTITERSGWCNVCNTPTMYSAIMLVSI